MKQSLNASQSEAVSHSTGPALVLAGPGSGKTLVITKRIENLIKKQGISPSNILVITFTRTAARQMRERFFAMMGEGHPPVTFGTFHAIFFSILKHAYHYTSKNIIREEQKYRFLEEVTSQMHLEYEDGPEFFTDLLSEISLVKNEGIAIGNYYAKNCAAEVFREIYARYGQKLRQARLLDFDDMLVYTLELFREREDILSLWQRQYPYILIDEFQDINALQFEIIRMMARPGNHLFAVGDDDQSIYRFRGAKPELMLQFPKIYPQAKILRLDVNYRCAPEIVQASGQLIGHNAQRFQKNVHTGKNHSGAVEFCLHQDQRAECKAVMESIQQWEAKGVPYHEMAVLFRTNTQPRMMMRQMMNTGIPFAAKDKIPNLYDHWASRDILTYIRIALGSRERKDFFKIMNRPSRYIGRDSLEDRNVDFANWMQYYREKPWIAKRIARLEYDLRLLGGMGPFAAVNYIRNGIGYDEFCKEYAKQCHIAEEDALQVLDELRESAREYPSYEAWFSHMEAYKEELLRQAKEDQAQADGVALATLHSAKGLEYEVVHIIDVNEGIMPYQKAVLDQDLEEERRMFYVGMTRAKSHLYLHSIQEQGGKKKEISRFIQEAGRAGEASALSLPTHEKGAAL